MPFTATETNNILNWALGKSGALPGKSAVWMALLKNDPEADGGTIDELSGDTYERVLINQYGEAYPALMGTASDRAIKSIAQINWTKATVDWEEVKGIALFTAKTGGTAYYYAKVPTPFVTEAGDVALFEAGNFRISMLDTDVDIADA